ncbi:MAG: toprim domain-containing protein [bacterium]
MELCSETTKYLLSDRKVSVESIEHFGVRVFIPDGTIIFPMTDIHNNVVLLQSRSIRTKSISTITASVLGLENVEFPKLSEVGAWFGLGTVDWRMPLLIVEGPIDAMKAYTFGFNNVVASLGATITKKQADVLCAQAYIIGLDSDKAGEEGADRISALLSGEAPMSIVKWNIFSENIKDCGDITDKDMFWKIIENRIPIYGKKNKKMS